ncbi:MAG: hypothetical protein JXC32_01890 [Anaerolineae bacterium]|nr:hypothetical protein [Anaerolineae bacterium]
MRQRTRHCRWACALLLVMVALACNFPALLRGPAEGTSPTPEATNTALPFATSTATARAEEEEETIILPTPTPTPGEDIEGEDCTYRAAYVADVTIPDDTVVPAGESFEKTWRIRNSGTCPWMLGTTFAYLSGDDLSEEGAIAVPSTEPDQEIELTVEMTAPDEPGTYRSNWQLETPDGRRYGGVFYVQIVVPGEANETPSPAPTEEGTSAPGSLFGVVLEDCESVIVSWVDGRGESAYRLSGPDLDVNLSANTTTYTWTDPPSGLAVITLTALDADDDEIASLQTTVGVTCDDGRPDLVPLSVTFVPTTPVAHLPVTATIEIENQGDADSGVFVVAWRGLKTASRPACQWKIDTGLEAGDTRELSCTAVAYSAAYADLVTTVEVDTTDIVVESEEDNNLLEESATVVAPEVVFDFVANAGMANWIGGPPPADIPWPGSPDGDQAYARLTGGTLETGSAIQGLCLETHPRQVAGGIVRGEYEDLGDPDYVIEPGDHFEAAVSLLEGATEADVTYRVMLILSESGGKWIASERHSYRQGIEILRADLTSYAGETANVILQVEAGDDGTDNQACWVRARIFRYP